MGDCDVFTLLASRVLRGALCADAGGMRAIAAPVRTRGWLDLSRIDAAFALTAAAIADDESRGFPRPVLLTVDEVSMVAEGGRSRGDRAARSGKRRRALAARRPVPLTSPSLNHRPSG